ncbi:hypothetical protein [Pedobacter agri]|uniref:hypothetical protein n=1 Tax=Pedobacter agri TaxID=454586 RepID=UPI000E24D64B|nr:hypothetical protein [Pedobacter agri]MDQ1142641.1 hypothetical protein [Pedobacter agri]
MLRNGKLASINIIDRCGIILDENDQEVPFYFNNFSELLGISEDVAFEIKLTDRGLAAVGVKMHALVSSSKR